MSVSCKWDYLLAILLQVDGIDLFSKLVLFAHLQIHKSKYNKVKYLSVLFQSCFLVFYQDGVL